MTNKVTFDIKKLEILEKALKKKYAVKVGILNDVAREGGMGNAEIGIIMEYGSFKRKIPPRSFLIMPINKKRKEILKKVGPVAFKHFMAGQPKKAYVALGLQAESVVQDAFTSAGFGTWKPLKEATIKAKGSSKPLIDTGQLRRSITSEVVTK